jgi:hypothetical protein
MLQEQDKTEEGTPGPRDNARAALWGAVLAATVAALTWVTSARGQEYTAMRDLALPAQAATVGDATVATPPGWQSGEALAVVLVAGPDRERLRARLVAELLAQRVVVVELTFAPDLDDAVAVATDAAAALAAVRAQWAPGATLLYGFAWDVGGAAAMLAAGADAGFDGYASLGAGCQVGGARQRNPRSWQAGAVNLGEAAMGTDMIPDAPFTELALACGLALVPPAPSGGALRLPARAAR